MVDFKPAVIPHDKDNGPDPKPVTDETTTPDGGEAVKNDNKAPQVTKTRTKPDGTQVEEVQGGKVASTSAGGKVA